MTFWWLVLATGLGTFLIRYLPLRHGQRLIHAGSRLERFFTALGVAALTALIVLSAGEVWWAAEDMAIASVAIVAGTLGVFVTLRKTGNIGLATLAGALIYGLASQGGL
ncbi:hypothetical protein GCM10027040_25410 [Halomonas shantousis]